MNRRLTVSLVALTCAALTAVPSQAAPKKKPAPIKGSYALTLLPDPTVNVFTTSGQSAPGAPCGVIPQAQDRHAFTIPAAGELKLVLDAHDPAPGTPYVFDWDLYLLDSSGAVINEGTSSEAHEEIGQKFKKGAKVTFLACNLNGEQNATVSYVFSYA